MPYIFSKAIHYIIAVALKCVCALFKSINPQGLKLYSPPCPRVLTLNKPTLKQQRRMRQGYAIRNFDPRMQGILSRLPFKFCLPSCHGTRSPSLFRNLYCTVKNSTLGYSRNDLPSIMTRVEEFERRKRLLSTGAPAVGASAAILYTPKYSPVPIDVKVYTWIGKENLRTNAALMLETTFEGTVCCQNNHNLLESLGGCHDLFYV